MRGSVPANPPAPPTPPPQRGGFFCCSSPAAPARSAIARAIPRNDLPGALAMMKLLSNPLSPYGRKVKLTMAMKGLKDKIELVGVDTNPGDNVEINSANPLGKIPALVIDGGTAIFDSHVICEYLDSLAPVAGAVPQERAGALQDADAGLAGRRHPRCGAAAGLREALPPGGEVARALAAAPARQDRPRPRSPGAEPAGLGRQPRLRPPDAGLRRSATSTSATRANGAPATPSSWPGSTSSPRPCRPSRRRGRRREAPASPSPLWGRG